MKKRIFAGLMAGTITSLALCMTAFAGTWQKAGNGWTYLKDNNQYANNEFVVDAGQLYFIGRDYQMMTGFVPINNAYYYFTPYGNMQSGWVYANNNWYYMSTTDGRMLLGTSFTDLNGKQYYLNADGTMAHDTIINGHYYGSDGALVNNNPYNYVPASNTNYSTPDLVTNRYTSSGSSTSNSDYNSSDDDDDSYSYSHGSSNAGNYDYDEYANEILKLVNKERKKYHRSALTLDSELCDYANTRAEQIVDDFSHDAFDEDILYLQDMAGTYDLGENIAKGQTSPANVMSAWNKSEGHHENIILKTYARLGVGVHYENGKYYWVQIFAGDGYNY